MTVTETRGAALPVRLRDRPAAQFALCLIFALILRISAFGDPAIHIDEAFYLLVGEMMHQGAIPYVDVWDRKPVGLFLLYYSFSAVLRGPLGYQLAAWLFVAGTAFLIGRIAGRLSGQSGATLASLIYIAGVNALQGIGGQSPVFYNLFVCAAFALVVRSIPALRAGAIPLPVHAAMALAGAAITIKTTTVFEGAFLGLFVCFTAARSGMPARRLLPVAGLLLLLGILPSACIAAWYWQAGHWAEFQHAMVTSNLVKTSSPLFKVLARLRVMVFTLAPLLILAGSAIRLDWRKAGLSPLHGLLAGWILAAVIGIVAIPNFFLHYALPLAVPLSVISASMLDRRGWGGWAALAAIAIFCLAGNSFDFARHRKSRESMQDLAAAMQRHSANGTALVFDASPYLYAMSGLRPLSPLVFPSHLNNATELNVSQFRTLPELKAILARHPGVIVMASRPRARAYSRAALGLVMHHAFTHCRPVIIRQTHEIDHDARIYVFGDCR